MSPSLWLGQLGRPWLGPLSRITGSFPPSLWTGQQVTGQIHPFSMEPPAPLPAGPPRTAQACLDLHVHWANVACFVLSDP